MRSIKESILDKDFVDQTNNFFKERDELKEALEKNLGRFIRLMTFNVELKGKDVYMEIAHNHNEGSIDLESIVPVIPIFQEWAKKYTLHYVANRDELSEVYFYAPIKDGSDKQFKQWKEFRNCFTNVVRQDGVLLKDFHWHLKALME